MKRHGGSSVSCDNAVALLGGMAAAETTAHPLCTSSTSNCKKPLTHPNAIDAVACNRPWKLSRKPRPEKGNWLPYSPGT